MASLRRTVVLSATLIGLTGCPNDEVRVSETADGSDSDSSGGESETDTGEETETDTGEETETETGPDGECSEDRDCEPGQVCVEAACVPEQNPPECGNGVLERGESCDAGADNGPGQACNASCEPNVCGDGDKGPGEGCDDGNAIDDDECSNECVSIFCGDGFVQASEECDDGNAVDDDECTSACTLPACGDEILQASVGEQCDDGGANSDHADCTTSCQIAACGDGLIHDAGSGTEECDLGGQNGPNQSCLADCVANVCGDADLGPGEGCDDGNTEADDGCSPVCVPEGCGNAIVDPGEECDDGNLTDDDECTNACALPECGDGIIQAGEGEQCDDGGLNSNIAACTLGCQPAVCGDGLVWDGQEQCDEGAGNDDQGTCKQDCSDQVCGDGFVGPAEGCDDGNDINDDECTNACKQPMCGDGILQAGEACDEGANNGGDGCTMSCTIPPCPCGYYHDTPNTCADQFPNVIFVSPLGPEFGTGVCWEDAVPNLQDALALAQPGDALWIAAANYKPGVAGQRDLSFVVPSGVSLYGGFAGNETALAQRNWVANETILSGDIDGNGYLTSNVAQLNSRHVVEIPDGVGARLDGLTIRGGYADGAGADATGAGVWVGSGTPQFANLLIEYNYALQYGRGLHVTSGSATLTAVDFERQDNIGFAESGALGVGPGASATMTGGGFLANDWYGEAFVAVGAQVTLQSITSSVPIFGSRVNGGTYKLINSTTASTSHLERGIEAKAGSHVEIINSTLSNYAKALVLIDSDAIVSGSTFSNNNTLGAAGDDANGAAIDATNSQLEVSNSFFNGNQAGEFATGSAIFTLNSTAVITGSEFANNNGLSNAAGQAIYAWNGTMEIHNSQFFDNLDGGVQLRDGTYLVADSQFIGNIGLFGGGILNDGNTTVVNCLFEDNHPTSSGGGIRSSDNLWVERSRFINNSTGSGGAISHGSPHDYVVVVHNSEFIGNTVTNHGGAMALDDLVEIANCTFTGNQAGVMGGALSMSQATLSVYNSSFANNSAPAGTGVIYGALSTIDVVNSVFWDGSDLIWTESPVSTSFAQVCAPEPVAGVGNLVIAESPYVDADGLDDVTGTEDDELALEPGGSCVTPGNAAERPSDWFDLDEDGDVMELLPLDLALDPRVSGGQMERGAYEL